MVYTAARRFPLAQVRVIAWVFICFVVALVLPNLALRRMPSLWTWLVSADDGSDLAVLGALRSADPNDVDIVVLGSSLAVVDVSKAMVERDTGLSLLNAGVLAMPPIASSMYLDEVLALGPSTVILVSGPRAFGDLILPDAAPFDWRIAASALPVSGWMRSDVLSAALADVSDVYRLREVPRLAWDGALARRDRRAADHFRADDDRFARLGRGWGRDLVETPTVVDGPASRAVGALIDRCTAHGVSVLLVAAPVHSDLLGTPGVWFHPPHLAEMRRIGELHGASVLVPDETVLWRDSDFRDPLHLAPAGQRRFTEAVVAALR
jgi:hypothetical protein